MRKITAASGATQKNQISCISMMAFIPMEPARMVGISNMVSIGISKETFMATWRYASINATLLLDAQSAIMMESVQIVPAAMIYSVPMFKSTPRVVGASGAIAHRIKTDIVESIGAML